MGTAAMSKSGVLRYSPTKVFRKYRQASKKGSMQMIIEMSLPCDPYNLKLRMRTPPEMVTAV